MLSKLHLLVPNKHFKFWRTVLPVISSFNSSAAQMENIIGFVRLLTAQQPTQKRGLQMSFLAKDSIDIYCNRKIPQSTSRIKKLRLQYFGYPLFNNIIICWQHPSYRKDIGAYVLRSNVRFFEIPCGERFDNFLPTAKPFSKTNYFKSSACSLLRRVKECCEFQCRSPYLSYLFNTSATQSFHF